MGINKLFLIGCLANLFLTSCLVIGVAVVGKYDTTTLLILGAFIWIMLCIGYGALFKREKIRLWVR